jgi:hypothetical protein
VISVLLSNERLDVQTPDCGGLTKFIDRHLRMLDMALQCLDNDLAEAVDGRFALVRDT